MENTELNILSSSSINTFKFDKINLDDPEPLHNSGFYFTRLSLGNDKTPLYFQLPECKTKQGVISVKNSKYIDLMFERNNHNDLMEWIEKLEYRCQDIIDSNKNLWFQSELTRDDIETMMSQIIRLYNSGKYMLMRVFIDVNKHTGNNKCISYDENQLGIDLETINPEQTIIPLIVIEGVKFSSRSFEISLKMVQVMVTGDNNKNTLCLIKKNKNPEKEPNIEKHNDVKEPILEKTILEEPILEEPNLEEPNLEEPNLEEPILEELILEKPILEKSILEEPILEEPILEEPNLEEYRLEEPNLEEPNLEEPISEDQILNISKLNKPLLDESHLEKTLGNQYSNNNDLEEVFLDYDNTSDVIDLKQPKEVYYKLYNIARENAKKYRLQAIQSYLESKKIKSKYMLFDIDDDSDDSDDSDYENYLG